MTRYVDSAVLVAGLVPCTGAVHPTTIPLCARAAAGASASSATSAASSPVRCPILTIFREIPRSRQGGTKPEIQVDFCILTRPLPQPTREGSPSHGAYVPRFAPPRHAREPRDRRERPGSHHSDPRARVRRLRQRGREVPRRRDAGDG